MSCLERCPQFRGIIHPYRGVPLYMVSFDYACIIVLCTDGRDYTGQSRRCRFPEGSLAGDSQCLSIPIIGNTVPDGDRGFRVLLTTFDQLVQIPPASNSLVVTITDNDRECVANTHKEH